MAAALNEPDLDRVRGILKAEEMKDDVSPNHRTKPMKVLCLGMGRTGTTSLATALQQLGYTPYDFIDRFYREHFHLWDDAIESKFLLNEHKTWGRVEFDKVTGEFDALLDIPCCLFVAELVAAYPDAKVILNVREDSDKWLASMNNTLFTVLSWPSWKILRYTEPRLCGRWFRHMNLIMQVFCDADRGELCRRKYIEHNEHVRNVVPASRLLEYRVTDGWDPLCQFLDLPTPVIDFPMGNRPEEFLETHAKLWKVAIYMSVRRAARFLLPMVVVLGSVWAWRRWE